MPFLNSTFTIAFLLLVITTRAQVNDVKIWQEELNAEYKDKFKSPLSVDEREKFSGHSFYAIGDMYNVKAKLEIRKDNLLIPFETSTEKVIKNKLYGVLYFILNDKNYQLNVYQSPDLMMVPGFEDYLFLPFTDLTTGNETYGGGRYIDLRVPKNGNEITINFNKAYNPYCAYSKNYSCPKVPAENDLNVKIIAGVKLYSKH